MPAAADELAILGQMKADVQAIARSRDILAEQLLDRCVVIGETVRKAREALEAELRRGAEARRFLPVLGNCKEDGNDVLRVYAVAREELAGWKKGADTLTPLIAEAEGFVRWLDGLLARLQRHAPPLDEQMLRERARQCDEAKSWVNLEDALAELKKSEG